MGDRIFASHGLNVKITDDNGLGEEDTQYQLAEVRVRKKDEEELIKAFSDFSNKMILTGHTDYDEYSEGIIKFFEEDMKLLSYKYDPNLLENKDKVLYIYFKKRGQGK